MKNDASVALVGEQYRGPFVVQSGRALFMVANDRPHPSIDGYPTSERSIDPGGNAYEASQWVVAELRFDTEACMFVEVSRVRYDWPREAFGSMLARVALGDEIAHDMIDRVTTDFSLWLAAQFRLDRRA